MNPTKTTIKVYSLISTVLGALALLSLIEDFDGYALVGGAFFLIYGALTLQYLNQEVK